MSKLAKKTVIVDDLTGEEGARSMTFSLGSQRWTIDLTDESIEKLRDALEPFIANADLIRSGASTSSAPRRSSNRDVAAVRSWARENGHEVREKGRIPASVMAAYEAAH